MEQYCSPEPEINTLAAYQGAIDDLFEQHTNNEVDGETFVTQAAVIVNDFEQNEAHQTQFGILSAQLRTAVAIMACCNPETEAAFRTNPFFMPPEDSHHQFCDDDHHEEHEKGSRKKKKKAAHSISTLILELI